MFISTDYLYLNEDAFVGDKANVSGAYKMLFEQYSQTVLTGNITPINYIRKLSDMFQLLPISVQSLSPSLYRMCYGPRDESIFKDIWAVVPNQSSAIFYEDYHKHYIDDPIIVLYGAGSQYGKFVSTDPLLTCFLDYDQGIEKEILKDLNAPMTRIYLWSIHEMKRLLSDLFGAHRSIFLPGTLADREKYLLHDELKY